MSKNTNLTDDGLRVKAVGLCPFPMSHYPSSGVENMYKPCKRCQSILLALKQVRDAAKKEERERCAKVAEDMDTNERDNPRSAKSHADNIATAIRQMDGGK